MANEQTPEAKHYAAAQARIANRDGMSNPQGEIPETPDLDIGV